MKRARDVADLNAIFAGRKVSMRQVALVAEVAPNTVKKILQGGRTSPRTAVRIAGFLGCRVDDLFVPAPAPDRHASRDQQAVA